MKLLSSCGLNRVFGTRVLGNRAYFHERVGSTQDEAKRLALSGEPEGSVVISRMQTRGRGKPGSEWFSPPGGLWFSLLLRPGSGLNPAILTLAGAAAAASAARSAAGVEAVIKWPNDCFAAGKKIGGVVGEKAGDAVVIGIGVNLNVPRESFPESIRERAGSVSVEAGFELDENLFLGELLRKFEEFYMCASAGRPAEAVEGIEAFSALKGRSVTGFAGGRKVEGTAVGYGEDGSLIIMLDSGARISFASGELDIEKERKSRGRKFSCGGRR